MQRRRDLAVFQPDQNVQDDDIALPLIQRSQ